MGPLVPQGIITGQWDFLIALILGIAFGYILERAGFSSTRKLVGVFYGYDFVVLQVFFTAAITAMTGVIFLNYFGLMDANMIYINPTYLWSVIVGGIIMGVGFLVGGYCPGTSFCGASIGKIDAIVFVGGLFLGIILFSLAFPWLEGLYKATPWGPSVMHEELGITRGMFAFIVIVLALAAFWITARLQKRFSDRNLKY